MNHSLTISASIVKGLFDAVIQRGIPPKQLKSLTGLSPDQLSDPDARIPLDKHIKLWKAAIQLTKDPALGLHIGEIAEIKHFGVVESVAMNSSTLREALLQVIRYFKLVSESDRVELHEQKDYATLIFSVVIPKYYTIQGVERSLAIALSWCRIFTGKEIFPEKVRFQHAPPEYISEHQRIFNAPLFFNQPDNALIFKKQYLNLVIPRSNSYLQKLLNQHAESLLNQLQKQQQM